MSTWLLVWNSWLWRDKYGKRCEEATKKLPVSFRWSCSKGLKKDPKGIIAHGVATEDAYEDAHWDEDKKRQGKRTYYVTAKYDALLDYGNQKILDLSLLKEKCEGQRWDPQKSGIRIKNEVLPTLRELWADIVEEANNNSVPTSDENSFNEESSYIEGQEKVVYTTKHERDSRVRKAFLNGKHLKCEACGFDFEKTYGKLGNGYIEVHHKKTVSEGECITDYDSDLVMLCSNCHKMIHRCKDHMITVEELKEIISKNEQ